jgi:hypothetical protein
MSCPPFKPQEIIARFQAGEWLDNTVYWMTYRDIWQDQSEVIRLAENLRMLGLRDTASDHRWNSAFKTHVDAFQKEHNQALDEVTYQHSTAYLYLLVKANTLLKNGPVEWCRIFLSSQISLGIIHLHEYWHQSHIRLDGLRNLIKEWQSTHGQTSASSDSQWYRALKTHRVKRLRFGSVD